MTYIGWKNWDTWAVNLWATNDGNFYKTKHLSWVKNIARKIKSKKYKRDLMIPAIKKYYVKPAISLAKGEGDIIDISEVDVREIVENLEEEARDWIRYG